MGGEHKPCMFYGFTTSIKYKDTTYDFTSPSEPIDQILYYCHVLTNATTLEDIQIAIAEYETIHSDDIARFNDFATSKGCKAAWILGLWGDVCCRWRRLEEEIDD